MLRSCIPKSMLSWPIYVKKGCLSHLRWAIFLHWPSLSLCSNRTELNNICWKNKWRDMLWRWWAAPWHNQPLLALTGTCFSLPPFSPNLKSIINHWSIAEASLSLHQEGDLVIFSSHWPYVSNLLLTIFSK